MCRKTLPGDKAWVKRFLERKKKRKKAVNY